MTTKTEADPYELLRRAKAIIERNKHRSENAQWLKDFKNLPGAKLNRKQLKVLRNQYRRYNADEEIRAITDRLLAQGYLTKVEHTNHRGTYYSIRLSRPKGGEALRLREDVPA